MRSLLLLTALAAAAAAGDAEILRHDLDLRLDPATSSFESVDRLRVRGPGRIEVPPWEGVEADRTSIEVGAGEHDVVVRFAGRIQDPVKKSDAATWVAGDRTAGTIGPEGSYLVRGFYVPSERPCLFRVAIEVPLPHRAVSQGRREAETEEGGIHRVTYASEHPADGLVVVTGPFVIDEEVIDGVSCRTYLYAQDREHSAVLLATLRAEVPRFQRTLGAVPDARFDVVENFFETGYGFPNFTLLGDTVIRYVCARSRGTLPAGYLDHELVHTWLGNHLHVDYEKGNWCEALTTYFTNYGAAEREDGGADHRWKVSRSYSLRVGPDNDYPLRAFTEKRHAHENDIGYGKGSMVFHMFARELGKERFTARIRDLVAARGGEKLGWDDVTGWLERGTGKEGWFAPWIERPGAPVLEIGTLAVEGLRIAGTIVQAQEGEAYRLSIPVWVTTEEGVEEHEVASASKETAFEIVAGAPPRLVELDPDHHMFRRVPRARVSPCLEGVRTAERRVGFGDAALLDRLGLEAIEPALPKDAAVLAIGLPEAVRAEALAGARRFVPDLEIEEGRFAFGGTVYERPDDALLLSYARPEAPGRPVTLFWGNGPEAYARARYLPYYGSDSWVVFRGGRPVARGNFATDRATRAEISPARRAAAEPIVRHLLFLTSPEHEGREAGTRAAYRLANELRGRLVSLGLTHVPTPPVALVRASIEGDARLTLAGKDHRVYPFHLTGPADPAVAFTRVVRPPADDVRDALVLLDESATHAQARELAGRGAAAVAVVASEPTGKARGDEAAWEGLVPPAVAERFPEESTNRSVAIAGLLQRTIGEAADRLAAGGFAGAFPVPYVYVPPAAVEGIADGAEVAGSLHFATRGTPASTANLVAVLGDPRQPGVLLSAHWDGVGRIGGAPAQGAADNAAGVAVVLAVAERLKRDHDAGRLGRPVVVALFGAEEMGLAGSRQFAARLGAPGAPVAKPRAAVNVDAVGSLPGDKVYLVGRSHHPDLLAAFERAIEGTPLALQRDIDRFAFEHGSDHWPLHEAGIPAVTVWSANYREMNTAADTLDKVDVGTLRALANAVHAMVLDLAGAP